MEKKEKAIFKVTIAAPIEHVWDRLTNTHDVLPFFFNSRIDTHGLKQGAQFRMRTKNGKYTGVIGKFWNGTHPIAIPTPLSLRNWMMSPVS